jgi:hypothetical protein
MAEEDLLKFSRWATGLEEAPDDKDGKLFYANIKMMMAEKGWGSKCKLLVNSLMLDPRYGNEYSDDDINAHCEASLEKSLDDLDEDEAGMVLDNYDETVEAIIKLASKPKKPSKKAKAEMPE